MSKQKKPVGSVITHSKAAKLLEIVGIECGSGENLSVDKVVQLKGVISKGEDYESAATVKALSLKTVGCLLRHCGITREAGLKATIAAVIESSKEKISDAEDEEGDTTGHPEDLAFAELFKTRIATQLPLIKCSGKRTGVLVVTDLTPAKPETHISIEIPKQTNITV